MSIIDRYFIPTLYLDDIYAITPEMLMQMGVKGIVSDIDNTLVTYDDAEPTEGLIPWLKGMAEAGIPIALVSNNSSPDRVRVFNRSLGYFATARAGKPFGNGVKRALSALGCSPSEAVMIGDQILTDILAGSRLGMKTILVKPIKDRTDLFHRFKRRIERPLLRRYARMRAR